MCRCRWQLQRSGGLSNEALEHSCVPESACGGGSWRLHSEALGGALNHSCLPE